MAISLPLEDREIRRCVRRAPRLNGARAAELEAQLDAHPDNPSVRYLALRSAVEPSVQPEVDRVRAELAQLVAQP